MKWFVTFIMTFLTMVICFKLGQITGKIDYNKELETANIKLEKCQTLWKLDADLFYLELCQTVCVEEFEKMSC